MFPLVVDLGEPLLPGYRLLCTMIAAVVVVVVSSKMMISESSYVVE